MKLNIDRNRVIKALIAKLKSSEFVVAMIPVTVQLSMKKLACFLDQPTLSYATVFISGDRRGVEIELLAKDLIQLTDAVSADLVD